MWNLRQIGKVDKVFNDTTKKLEGKGFSMSHFIHSIERCIGYRITSNEHRYRLCFWHEYSVMSLVSLTRASATFSLIIYKLTSFHTP